MPDLRARCDDPTVAEWLDDWLREARLEPPTPIELRVVVRDDATPPADPRPPFPQPDIEIRSGGLMGDVRVTWTLAPAYAILAPGACIADVVLSPQAAALADRCARTFMTVVLVLLLRRAGWHHIHAASAIAPDGRAWLFAGNAKDGKSTTAALLATRGWAVGGDDLSYLAAYQDGVHVIAQHAPIALRPGGLDLLGPRANGTPTKDGRKTAFFPEELGGRWVRQSRPDILVLPRVGGEATRAERISHAAAMIELVKWSAWLVLEPELAQAHLDLLARLARQASCWRVELGRDLFGSRDLLAELITT